ncbi:UNVERIFIED_CONTAM: hypothetical protein GTU68_048509 [Idotea baltica]|nr:hypothetical protein [Idotea baltica]
MWRKCDEEMCKFVIPYVRPCNTSSNFDECNYGSYPGRCVICGGPG